ncbi:MAG: hypothetical protein JOZ26_11480 [Hyphomicrobiales bacterium]|jgi:uncharacterized protein YndB with AHSA1/START domain|nr:hypothetical protein [Hyphomicrobiales bacterium]MBV8420624.1 hypothetical protein [Hyphomicrobiales bacterium]
MAPHWRKWGIVRAIRGRKCWRVPTNFTCHEVQIDFRVGGTYRAMISSPAHGENGFGGVYGEIVAKQTARFHVYLGQRRPVRGRRDARHDHLRREERQDGPDRPSKALPHVERRDSHGGGWTSAFDKLAAYAAQIAKEHSA